MPDRETPHERARSNAATERPSTVVPKFALDAADAKIAEWSGMVMDTADAIDRLLASESLPVPDSVRELAGSTTQKLRSLGSQSGEHQTADLVIGLQRAASAHPAASIGVGAAIGAALAALVVKLGSASASKADTTGSAS